MKSSEEYQKELNSNSFSSILEQSFIYSFDVIKLFPITALYIPTYIYLSLISIDAKVDTIFSLSLHLETFLRCL